MTNKSAVPTPTMTPEEVEEWAAKAASGRLFQELNHNPQRSKVARHLHEMYGVEPRHLPHGAGRKLARVAGVSNSTAWDVIYDLGYSLCIYRGVCDCRYFGRPR